MKFTFPTQDYEEVTSTTNLLRKHWVFWLALVSTCVACLGGSLEIFIKWRSLPPYVPLWFSRPWGQERLASTSFLFIPLASTLVSFIINWWAAIKITKNYPIFARVLFLNAALVSILGLIITIRIVGLVS